MLPCSLALIGSLHIGISVYSTSKSLLSYQGGNFIKSQPSCANCKYQLASTSLEVHFKYNTKSLQIPRDSGSAPGKCEMSSFLCRSDKALSSINAEALLSFSVIIFKMQLHKTLLCYLLATYLDYRLTSPQVETHHMALCRTNLVLVYYPRDSPAWVNLYSSMLQPGSNSFGWKLSS